MPTPWATHGVVDEESLRKRAVVVRARRADREVVVAAAREQDRVVGDVAADHLPICKRIDPDPKRQVGPGRGGL